MNTIKNIKGLFVLAAITLLPLVTLAQSFQGVIEMRTTSIDQEETSNVKWYIKNGSSKMVIDANVKGVSMKYAVVFKKGDPDAHIIMDNAVNNVPASQLTGKTELQVGVSGAAIGVGKKEVAGYACTSVINNKGQVTAWVSDKTGVTADDLPELMRSQGMINVLISLGVKGIPLEVTQYNDKGEVKMTQTITSIRSTSVSDSEFNTANMRSLEENIKEMNK